ncbi:MAG TPA: M14 family metallopeptidase [Candidatus Paceibacterota bacterium]|nr:M14 family metallopeptidase [Candidatus Paceibacterota bacterium]
MSAGAKWGIGVVIVILLGVAAYFLLRPTTPPPTAPAPAAPQWATSSVIGKTVQGRDITEYTYGTGPTHILLVGGMHGGYEWNAVLLAYQVMDYLKANPASVPADLSVTVIPSLNADGVYKVTGKEGVFTPADVSPDPVVDAAGRFNADNVDLNRNFGCHWQATSTWQNKPVSAGTAAFSEPEAAALRDFVATDKPVAVVFWHSASGSVYTSACDHGVLPGTVTAMKTYATASGYTPAGLFDAYPITGDSEGWLASLGIPAITVEFKTHTSVEFAQNIAGVKALLALYSTATTIATTTSAK